MWPFKKKKRSDQDIIDEHEAYSKLAKRMTQLSDSTFEKWVRLEKEANQARRRIEKLKQNKLKKITYLGIAKRESK